MRHASSGKRSFAEAQSRQGAAAAGSLLPSVSFHSGWNAARISFWSVVAPCRSGSLIGYCFGDNSAVANRPRLVVAYQ